MRVWFATVKKTIFQFFQKSGFLYEGLRCARRARKKKRPEKGGTGSQWYKKRVFWKKNANSKKNPEKSRQIGGFCIGIRVAKMPHFFLVDRAQPTPSAGLFTFLFWILGFYIGIPFLEWTFFLSAFGFYIGNLKIAIKSLLSQVRQLSANVGYKIGSFFFSRQKLLFLL